MEEFVRLGDVADQIMPAFTGENRERMPVLNHEPRQPVGSTLWKGLWHRDGGTCWICGYGAVRPVADHVRPRSNWPADEIELADRSDNLRLACWDCNTDKSNYEYQGGGHPLGIVMRCIRCQGFDRQMYDDVFGDVRLVPCYCFRCGMGGLCQSPRMFLAADENV